MTTRIYRQSPGRWVVVTRHPSGGVVRETYGSGRAALIALDGRNRERRERPKPDLKTAFRQMAELYARLCGPGRRVPAPAYVPPGRIPRGTAPNGPHDYQGWIPQ